MLLLVRRDHLPWPVAQTPSESMFLRLHMVLTLYRRVQVGLDMVNIQIPLKTLDPDVADRIEWVHCNMYASSRWPVRRIPDLTHSMTRCLPERY